MKFTLATATLCLLAVCRADDLSKLPHLGDYSNQRASSTDPSGGNDDGNGKNQIRPGETRTIADLTGPGIITHIWFTIASRDSNHLKALVLRIYWDGDSSPAVETPVGDFFGLGLGRYMMYESGPISVGSQKALNCFFPMPFRRSAKMTITNDGKDPVGAFYYNIDWEKHARLADDLAYFYAEYRQAAPNRGTFNDWQNNGSEAVNEKKNLDGKGNYVFFETEGRGHFVGVMLSILQNQGDWWGEGDEMMFIDDKNKPAITGTGSEDYFLGAWSYAGSPLGNLFPTFAFQRYGNPQNGGNDAGAKWMVYRFHIDSPVEFRRYFRMTIEHGHANHRSDNFYSIAFWYQQGPHRMRAALPSLADRTPHLVDAGGPTMGKP